MKKLSELIKDISEIIKDSDSFDWSELDKTMIELHTKLTEPKWAIEDEKLRKYCEDLVISWTAHKYIEDNALKI